MAAADLQNGLRKLNIMLKAWQADGVKYWLMTEGELALVQSQESYSFAAGGDFTTVPFDMMDMRITRVSNDLPMSEMSREEYNALPNKTTEGYPTSWFYDRQRESGTLYVWPAPDSTAGTLKFTYRRTIMDMDASADAMDLPQEWYDAVINGLGYRLVRSNGLLNTPEGQDLKVEAGRTYSIVKAHDTGEGAGSLFIYPDDSRAAPQ
ncbi:MAG: hypothetical protein GY933_00210 [Hyphomicrobiales bacterium]|nr:hypothetical protein [Hyphomicrobiales bacterium]